MKGAEESLKEGTLELLFNVNLLPYEDEPCLSPWKTIGDSACFSSEARKVLQAAGDRASRLLGGRHSLRGVGRGELVHKKQTWVGDACVSLRLRSPGGKKPNRETSVSLQEKDVSIYSEAISSRRGRVRLLASHCLGRPRRGLQRRRPRPSRGADQRQGFLQVLPSSQTPHSSRLRLFSPEGRHHRRGHRSRRKEVPRWPPGGGRPSGEGSTWPRT